MKKVAIFASGTGSNFVNLVKNEELKDFMSVELMVCDKTKAKVIERSEELGVKTLVFSAKDYACKKDYEDMILSNMNNIDYILLAGYMRIISPYFLENFQGKIINIHPSILPAYKGKDSIKRAYENKEEEIGVSVHFVNEEVDGGQILAQDKFTVDYDMDLDQVTEQVHKIEHKLYPQVLLKLFKEEQ